MNNAKTNCCGTENLDCNTPETNCCATDEKLTRGNNKKKMGFGILLLALLFAVVSAFSTDRSGESVSCGSDSESCATSCETGSTGTSCCTKK